MAAPNYISFTEKIQPYITIIFGKHFNLVLFCIYITTNYIYEQMVAVFRQKRCQPGALQKKGEEEGAEKKKQQQTALDLKSLHRPEDRLSAGVSDPFHAFVHRTLKTKWSSSVAWTPARTLNVQSSPFIAFLSLTRRD